MSSHRTSEVLFGYLKEIDNNVTGKKKMKVKSRKKIFYKYSHSMNRLFRIQINVTPVHSSILYIKSILKTDNHTVTMTIASGIFSDILNHFDETIFLENSFRR